jgi:hypothetical protein
MPKFAIVYLGGEQASNEEEGKKNLEKYRNWLQDLGEKAVSPANPFKNTHIVSPNGSVTKGSGTTMSGYTIIESKNMDEALQHAKACPFLDINGTLEVSELLEM